MPKLISLDFETYYGGDYTLNKMTTEEYVRDPRFEAIMMGYKLDDDPRPHSVVGAGAIKTLLDGINIEDKAVLCHHAHFDGLILSHHFGVKPKIWFDTLSMARALHVEVGGSLRKLMDHYNVGVTKGTAVNEARGKRLHNFTEQEMQVYREYCQDDVEGMHRIFKLMLPQFPLRELQHIDMLVRCFTEPILEGDREMLLDYEQQIQADKLTLLFASGVTLEEVMSNQKFAEALKRLGVDPPMKRSNTTGQMTFAFAKTDKAFLELAEHDDIRVQTLVAARLGNKTTIEETRARRLADMSLRGPLCVYYKFAGAKQTMRVAGGDKTNFQNLKRGGTIRDAIYAPEGYELVVPDSSNIEARTLDYVACQEDALQIYRDADAGIGPDVYCVIASRFYNRQITEADKDERQLGKTIKLACGYQMGAERFQETTRILSGGRLVIDFQTALRGVQAYRTLHPMVVQLWNRAESALPVLASGSNEMKYLDSRNILQLEKGAILLPNGLRLRYPQLSFTNETKWSFLGPYGERSHLYGGKVVEHVTQALAKIVVMDQLLKISRKFKLAMTSHDEGAFCVPEGMGKDVLAYSLEVMSVPPPWAPTLPLKAKGQIAIRYGDAK